MALFQKVEHIEYPVVDENLTTYLTDDEAEYTLRSAASLMVQNKVYEAIQQAVDQYRNVEEITYKQIDDLKFGNDFVFCGTTESIFLMGAGLEANQIFASRHCGMDGKIIVLSLKDRSKILEYNMVITDAIVPGQIDLNLKMKFFLESTAGKVYKIDYKGFEDEHV
jgi:hypothetical protein